VGLQEAPLLDTERYGMKDSELKASLERAKAAYEALVRTRASLGTMLAEAIRRDGGLPEFRRRREDLPLLLRSAALHRAEMERLERLGSETVEQKKEEEEVAAP
jgi:hypothetical protein